MERKIQEITERKAWAEYVQYTGLKIETICMEDTFTILNLAEETMQRSIPDHRHGSGDWEFHLIIGGRGLVRINQEERLVEKGDWFLVGPHTEHLQISYKEDPMQEQTIYLHKEGKPNGIRRHCGNVEKVRADRKKSGAGISHGEAAEKVRPTYYLGSDDGKMAALLQRIFTEMKKRQLGYTSYVRLLLEQLLLELLRGIEQIESESRAAEGFYSERVPQEGNAEAFVDIRRNTSSEGNGFPHSDLQRMQDFLVEKAFLYNYADLTLADLAERVGLSERQLQRHLRERYNSTFLEMRRQARMAAAKMLLLHTDQSIQRISEEVGYSTAEHFTAVFTRAEGVPPRTWGRK